MCLHGFATVKHQSGFLESHACRPGLTGHVWWKASKNWEDKKSTKTHTNKKRNNNNNNNYYYYYYYSHYYFYFDLEQKSMSVWVCNTGPPRRICNRPCPFPHPSTGAKGKGIYTSNWRKSPACCSPFGHKIIQTTLFGWKSRISHWTQDFGKFLSLRVLPPKKLEFLWLPMTSEKKVAKQKKRLAGSGDEWHLNFQLQDMSPCNIPWTFHLDLSIIWNLKKKSDKKRAVSQKSWRRNSSKNFQAKKLFNWVVDIGLILRKGFQKLTTVTTSAIWKGVRPARFLKTSSDPVKTAWRFQNEYTTDSTKTSRDTSKSFCF